ncbi:MAG: sulfite exporter TauE/SafE family protein [Candidatus Melainabacteria bacterium]|nr:sulfite exporter TauE/SafE family protein [Candidatus Melainabacteria bacterium]
MTELNLFYIFTALLFGMVHAMEPGHGKSLVATFVLSSNTSRTRDAFLIGLIASITHTASVYIIGFLSLKFLEFISPIEKEMFISFTASILIFLIGLWLMWDRVIEPLFHHEHEHHCSVHDVLTKKLKATSILLIGLTAGLFPCSGGLTVFMTATAVGGFKNLLNGFFYVLSFSVGLGMALTLVALSMIFGQGFLKSILQKSISNIERSSGVISAVLIYTLGLVLLTSNIVKIMPYEHHHYHLLKEKKS